MKTYVCIGTILKSCVFEVDAQNIEEAKELLKQQLFDDVLEEDILEVDAILKTIQELG